MSEPHQTLYQPDFEHDACGVGMICRIDGGKRHKVVSQALKILRRLEHRGAVGADPETGDGAGILVQIPHDYLARDVRKLGFSLPDEGDYGLAQLFLQKGEDGRTSETRERVERSVGESGLRVLGWRRVPTRSSVLGESALEGEPEVWQLFIERPSDVEPGDAFERKLFVTRRRLENQATGQLFVTGLSSRTVVYKGMLTVTQLSSYYEDLQDPAFKSAVAIVHSRFSTNTLPQWHLAHPFRYLAHNGEINTLRGNANWMRAREHLFASEEFGDELEEIRPVLSEGGSDSQQFDQALELLRMTGRSLPHAMMMLVPEAWEHDDVMDEQKRSFYEYHSCLMEPWDGPAAVLFSDGRFAGGLLDRNGLRPGRYVITHDGYLVVGSEAGTLDLEASRVKENGRLRPGNMLLVDLKEGRLVGDEEIKASVAGQRPYGEWVAMNMQPVAALPSKAPNEARLPHDLTVIWRAFGYTRESLELLLAPMAEAGKEPLGSMGRDIPLSVLSDQPRPLFDFFKQLFAQVTNPPLDAIREQLVTSLSVNLGGEGNLFAETPEHARMLRLDRPVISMDDLNRIEGTERATALETLVPAGTHGEDLRQALSRLCDRACAAIDAGSDILILTDRALSESRSPIPALLAVGAVHHHLIATGRRSRCSLVVSSGEPREVHHFCTLVGYGANAVHPWLALETASRLTEGSVPKERARENCLKALNAGLLKVMSKMGISTVQSYCGAQIFEAVGIHKEVIDLAFVGTPSRIGGVKLEEIARTYQTFHEHAWKPSLSRGLPEGGTYRWRRDGEHHMLRPLVVAKLQEAVRADDADSYRDFARMVNDQSAKLGTLRGLLDFSDNVAAIPIDEVEPWTEIVKRFKSGAMSYGSISGEAHSTLAKGMNRLGGRSNTGEGGEDPERYSRGNPARSRIKQVASGRFGVTMAYLGSADEIQIKMAQGAKPGEGGQLPGTKVYPWIARTRHSTPYVGLISPPPHHDIYSIEDLAQLIFDLRNTNPEARISVKLVSAAGVGTIAAGVAKAKADVVLISGHDGGTGASPRNSILHAGLPWEMGLSEAHQTLVRNGLRGRITVECDGGLRTGRDAAMAALLGADEFGFATIPLVAMGCIMMRKCHLNTCPVGIATQDPELRARFKGQPEHVINYFHFVAEELRTIMASLGIRTLDEMVGRVELLEQREVRHPRGGLLDLSRLIAPARTQRSIRAFANPAPEDQLAGALDLAFIREAAPALKHGTPVRIRRLVDNTHRTIGTLLSRSVLRTRGNQGLPADTITLDLEGSAGQSFMAFAVPGVTARLTGQVNDYLAKGLSGGRVIISPPDDVGFRPHEQIAAGNVGLYGATSGQVFIRGRAGERFAVRNSGAEAVVEGVGDHGCEYMTGGRVVVLGPTGRNFAAGMSGGIAYVLDGTRDFRTGRCTSDGVELQELSDPNEIALLHSIVLEHRDLTGSDTAGWALDNWDEAVREFVKVMPLEYKAALARMEAERVSEANFAAA